MDAFDLRFWNGFKQAGGSLSEPAIVDQITIDSRRIDSSHSLFVALKGEKLDGHDYVRHAAQSGAKYALVSEQWICPSDLSGLILLRVKNPLKAFQELAKTYRLLLPVKIIGVAGSFGKTMIKDLLFSLLTTEKKTAASPESFNSQIGVPLSLLTIRKEDEMAIIEASISQKQEMEVLADLIQPDYTLLTPIGKKHLATLQDLSTLTEETLKLIWTTKETGWSLLPTEVHSHVSQACPPFSVYFWDETSPKLPHATSSQCDITVPVHYQVSFPDQSVYHGQLSAAYAYSLNLINMASKAAWLSGISASNIQTVFQHYHPEPMRTEIWKVPTGTTFINDTYCSDPQSVDLALKHFNYAADSQRKIVVFGGMRGKSLHENNDYRRIGKTLAQAHLRHLLLFGNKPFRPLIEEMEKNSSETEILAFESEKEVLAYLQSHVQAQDFVLLKGEKKFSLDHLTETFNESQSHNQCMINLASIKNNLDMIQARLPSHTRLMIMVKALAYGTDDVRMAKFLASYGIDILGVSYVDEGVRLKRAGISQSIFSISAALYEVAKVVKWDLEVGVSDREFILALEAEAKRCGKQMKVHLHINTGMGRFGCRQEEALELAKIILSQPHLILEGIMTHFACADDPQEDAFTTEQIRCFDSAIATLKAHGITAPWTHAANSSGVVRFSLSQYNMVRIGLASYGLYGSESVKAGLDLRLALSLTSRVVGINICKLGETVSYGRRYRIEQEVQKIAVLPIGYFDGLHRNYSGKSHVLIRGKKAPMVGNICMDYMMVDVTHIPDIKIGDKVLIFGEDECGQYLSPEELASNGDSIVHELITCLGPRIQRIFVYEEGRQIR